MLSKQAKLPNQNNEDFTSPTAPPKYKLINNLNLSGLGIRRHVNEDLRSTSQRNIFS